MPLLCPSHLPFPRNLSRFLYSILNHCAENDKSIGKGIFTVLQFHRFCNEPVKKYPTITTHHRKKWRFILTTDHGVECCHCIVANLSRLKCRILQLWQTWVGHCVECPSLELRRSLTFPFLSCDAEFSGSVFHSLSKPGKATVAVQLIVWNYEMLKKAEFSGFDFTFYRRLFDSHSLIWLSEKGKRKRNVS